MSAEHGPGPAPICPTALNQRRLPSRARTTGGTLAALKQILNTDIASGGLERETGVEPATRCLGNRWVASLASPDALGQFLPENRSFWASYSGHPEHLIVS